MRSLLTETEFYLQSFDVGSGGRRVWLPAEQVEGEEGEVEHVGGGEAVVRQAGQVTEQRNSGVLTEVQTTSTALSPLHHLQLIRILALAQFCQEDQK